MAKQYALTSASWAQVGVAGTVTATVTAPDATTQVLAATTGAPQNPSGWTVWFTPQEIGAYAVAWASTGGQTGTSTITVTAPAAHVPLLTIQDCLLTLKLPTSMVNADPDRDRDMLAYAAAAEAVAESITGPVAPATVTEVHDGGRASILLRARPTSILAVQVGGYPATGWTPDFAAGIIHASGGGWAPGRKNVSVTYTVGSGRIRPNVMLGIRELFRQLWERSRALGGVASPEIVMQGFAVPNAVYELLAPDAAMPGFA